MINQKITGFAVNPEMRQRINDELSNNPQGRKILEVLKKGGNLSTNQQEFVLSFLHKLAIDTTSLLIGGKLRGDITKTIIDVIGNRMFTPMVTNYRNEYKTIANPEMVTNQVKIFQTTIRMSIKGIFKTIPNRYHVRYIKLDDTREHKQK